MPEEPVRPVGATPDLKASTNFQQLQGQLVDTENRIAFARQYYNDVVRQWNTKIQSVPTNILAGMMKAQKAEYFEIQDITAARMSEALSSQRGCLEAAERRVLIPCPGTCGGWSSPPSFCCSSPTGRAPGASRRLSSPSLRCSCSLIVSKALLSVSNTDTSVINKYDVDYTIAANGSMNVVETIDVEFTESKHGIFRFFDVTDGWTVSDPPGHRGVGQTGFPDGRSASANRSRPTSRTGEFVAKIGSASTTYPGRSTATSSTARRATSSRSRPTPPPRSSTGT